MKSIILILFLLMGCSPVEKAVKKPLLQEQGFVDSKELSPQELKQLQKILDELGDIPFNFDDWIIPIQGLDVLKKDIEILNNMLAGRYLKITIEGHCDERGTDEYNLALGDRRAKFVKDYLIDVQFPEKSLSIISYGEERPKINEHTEEAWTANRRVHLVVQ